MEIAQQAKQNLKRREERRTESRERSKLSSDVEVPSRRSGVWPSTENSRETLGGRSAPSDLVRRVPLLARADASLPVPEAIKARAPRHGSGTLRRRVLCERRP